MNKRAVVCGAIVAAILLVLAWRLPRLLRSRELERANRLVVIDGNSMSDPRMSSFPRELQRLLGPACAVDSVARNGQTTVNMLRHASDRVDSLYRSGRINQLVAWEITNDLLHGASQTDAYARFRAYCSDRKRKGWTITVLTVLPRHDPRLSSAFASARSAINADMRVHYRDYADHICDVASIPELGDPDNKRYFRDGTHLTDAGYAVVAERVANCISHH